MQSNAFFHLQGKFTERETEEKKQDTQGLSPCHNIWFQSTMLAEAGVIIAVTKEAQTGT